MTCSGDLLEPLHWMTVRWTLDATQGPVGMAPGSQAKPPPVTIRQVGVTVVIAPLILTLPQVRMLKPSGPETNRVTTVATEKVFKPVSKVPVITESRARSM